MKKLKNYLLRTCSYNVLGYLLYVKKIDEYLNSVRGQKNLLIARRQKWADIFATRH